jgi:hypothetical protein
MKRTLKRELKGTEIAEREGESLNGLAVLGDCQIHFSFCMNTRVLR